MPPGLPIRQTTTTILPIITYYIIISRIIIINNITTATAVSHTNTIVSAASFMNHHHRRRRTTPQQQQQQQHFINTNIMPQHINLLPSPQIRQFFTSPSFDGSYPTRRNSASRHDGATQRDDNNNNNGSNDDDDPISSFYYDIEDGRGRPNQQQKQQQKISPPSDDDDDDDDNSPKKPPPLPSISTLTHQFQSFLTMALPYYEESRSGRWLFAGMIGLTLLNSGVSVAFSYIGRDFWSALSSKDTVEFYNLLVKFSAALVVGAPVSVLYRWQRERLAVAWREWMTNRTLSLYYSNRVYYTLERNNSNNNDTTIDNPDQRITEDVRSFTAFSLTLFLTILTSSIDLVSFSLILYSIQPQLFLAIVAYAMFGTITTTVLGRRLVPLNFEKLRKEADFRYALVRIRENAESVAFYKGEGIEKKEVTGRFEKVLENKRDLIRTTRNLEFFTTAYQYFIQVLPVSVVAPQYFAGKIQLGVVSQSSGAFNHILNDLSVIVNQFEELSAFSAGIGRLEQFMIAIRDADPQRVNDRDGHILKTTTTTAGAELDHFNDTLKQPAMNMSSSSPSSPFSLPTISIETFSAKTTTHISSILSIQNLNLLTPDRKRLLINNLTISLPPQQNLLIVGNSGAGKSSLLRAVAGLWNAGTGSIHRPIDEEVYFLPQRPYCVLGTLRDQLLYPRSLSGDDDGEERRKRSPISIDDEELLSVLDRVGLSSLPLRFVTSSSSSSPRRNSMNNSTATTTDNNNNNNNAAAIRGLSVIRDWSNTLSLGEQQRIAFARVLINKPRLLILDEATSALDMVTEERMYKLLKDITVDDNGGGGGGGGGGSVGVTYVSVGHRRSLLNYHDVRLRIDGDDTTTSTSTSTSSTNTSSTTTNNGVRAGGGFDWEMIDKTVEGGGGGDGRDGQASNIVRNL